MVYFNYKQTTYTRARFPIDEKLKKMFWFKLFVLFGLVFCAESGKNDCPPEFVGFSGSCYYFSRAPETWHEAHFECRDRNAHLAVVQKKWQDKNLRFYLNYLGSAEPLARWIGGIYNWKAMIWVWGPTGKPLRYRGFPKKQEPADNRWKCIAMDPQLKYKWNPMSCIERLHYICEIPKKKSKKRQKVKSNGTVENNRINVKTIYQN